MAQMTISDLLKKRCTACAPGTPPLSEASVRGVLRELPGWELANKEIAKTYKFANYHETMAFVNATAWISHREDHHPDLEVGYNRCLVRYSTHSIGGISENDLICAAKVEGLVGNG
ncbi:MAG TPA: 4a-hydroxytetrahydrobiopterin dehydratase [Tepidisphaeraceae bacterium]|jgi:4a-hydroxytetrahydrobiopterin dehydratase